MGHERLSIEVVYALPDTQDVVVLSVAPGTTVAAAVALSGLAQRYSEIDPGSMRIGIFGCIVAGDTVLRDGDRVEIYRALVADAKQARRRRVKR